MGEDRPLFELKLSPTVTFRQHLCADDIRGHQVRRELNAFKRHAQGLAQGFYEERFTQTGHAFQQYVSTGKKGDEDFADNIAITNEDRKSTRLNSSHSQISYAVFCLKKKKKQKRRSKTL